MLESEKRSFRPSPAMLERTRKNSELNDSAGEVTEVYIPFLLKENLRNQNNTAGYEKGTELNIKLKQYVPPTMKKFLMAIRASNFSCSGYPSFTRLNMTHVTSPDGE